MKNLKHILLFFPLLLMFSACKKVKLDDDRGKLLVGKWKYQYFGQQLNQAQFQIQSQPQKDYSIEFFDKGELEIISEGVVKDYRISNMSESTIGTYAQWVNQIAYKKGQDEGRFYVNYFSQDSIMISDLPYPSNSFLNSVGNIFYRVE
jgi:hypothetical protein